MFGNSAMCQVETGLPFVLQRPPKGQSATFRNAMTSVGLMGAWIVLPAIFLVALGVSIITGLLRNKIVVKALPLKRPNPAP